MYVNTQVFQDFRCGDKLELEVSPSAAQNQKTRTKKKKKTTLAKVINNSSIISPKERRRRKRGGKAYFMAGWLSERRHPVLSRLHMM